MAGRLPLIALLMIPGVYSDDGWRVSYSSLHICALKGSTVTIKCRYTYPTGYKIIQTFWTKTQIPTDNVFPDLFKDSEYRERIQYLGDKQSDCNVRLTDVRHTDSHEYYFRFITNKPDGKWLGLPGVTLDVTDNPVISISSSGVIVEGDSVNLTCSSESNPPVHIYSWFKGKTSVGSGNIFSITNIRSDHSGQYKCKTKNTCGEKYSDSVTLNVLYPPDNPVISISSSGVIVEGDSVNLTCSSESNPPANISWFKGETSVGSGNIYRISNIRSDHSGQYKCKAENKLGHKYSAVTLNVLYPPKKVSASISSSGVIVEGDSVNLTCSSESNPPVHIYSWFKENQTSSVGSGQSFRPLESGWFYCVVQNKVGFQRSAAVSLIVPHISYWRLPVGITAACGGLFIIAIIIVLIWFIMRKRRAAKTEDAAVNQENQQDDLYCNVKHVDGASESAHCDDEQYASVGPQRLGGEQTTAGEAPESRDPEELEYATVRHQRNTEKTENHYSNITKYPPDAAVRSNVEDISVIYSSVK